MATTIKESFRQYASNLEITNRQESLVSTSRINVVDSLNEELYLHDEESKVIGSWDRNTLTRYLSEGDVDVMIVLDYGKNKHWDTSTGTSECLEKFKTILKGTYPDTKIVVDDNCVTLQFSQFRLDAVPAFKLDTGGYQIPDSRRKMWVKTNPLKFQSLITEVNRKMDDKFVPLIKMVKGWNRDKGWPIRSFHLECIMYSHYKSYTEGYTYNSMLRYFFSSLPSYVSQATYDPVTGERVDTYLNVGDKREIATKKATAAASASKEAYEDEDKYLSVAIREWKELLGEFFPAYG